MALRCPSCRQTLLAERVRLVPSLRWRTEVPETEGWTGLVSRPSATGLPLAQIRHCEQSKAFLDRLTPSSRPSWSHQSPLAPPLAAHTKPLKPREEATPSADVRGIVPGRLSRRLSRGQESPEDTTLEEGKAAFPGP